jgi:hypothetical protein
VDQVDALCIDHGACNVFGHITRPTLGGVERDHPDQMRSGIHAMYMEFLFTQPSTRELISNGARTKKERGYHEGGLLSIFRSVLNRDGDFLRYPFTNRPLAQIEVANYLPFPVPRNWFASGKSKARISS